VTASVCVITAFTLSVKALICVSLPLPHSYNSFATVGPLTDAYTLPSLLYLCYYHPLTQGSSVLLLWPSAAAAAAVEPLIMCTPCPHCCVSLLALLPPHRAVLDVCIAIMHPHCCAFAVPFNIQGTSVLLPWPSEADAA